MFRKTVTTVASLLLVFSLSGCAAPLSAKDVSLSVDLGEWAFSLVGDEAVIAAKVDLLTANKETYTLAIQTKTPAEQWTTLKKQQSISGSKVAKFSLKLDKASELVLRAAILGSDNKVVATSAVAKLVVKDLGLEVRNLSYNGRIACQDSQKKCSSYILNHAYPNLWDKTSPLYKQVASSKLSGSWGTPDVSTLVATPEWLVPFAACEPVAIDKSKPVPGRTFMVSDGAGDYHVTYLNGFVYYYPDIFNGYC